MKTGQISMEVMYAVGVMIVIFLILTGISFQHRRDIADTDEFLKKKNECLKLADTLSVLGLGQADMNMNLTFKYTTHLYKTGVVLVGDTTETVSSIEATCAFSGTLEKDYLNVLGKHTVTVRNGTVISVV